MVDSASVGPVTFWPPAVSVRVAVTGTVSLVVATWNACAPAVAGLTTSMVTTTWSPAEIFVAPHRVMVAPLLLTLSFRPHVWPVVTSSTWSLPFPVKSVPPGR